MNNRLSKKIVGVVVVLAIVAVGAAWLWRDTADYQAQLGAVGSLGITTPPAVVEPVSVLVEDQFPGPIIFVSAVSLPKGGWVVIHRDEGGKPGAIAGAGYFDKEVTTGEINLAKPTLEGEQYFAVLYRDNGDLNFNAKTDLAYRDVNGQLVSASFNITKSLPEHKG